MAKNKSANNKKTQNGNSKGSPASSTTHKASNGARGVDSRSRDDVTEQVTANTGTGRVQTEDVRKPEVKSYSTNHKVETLVDHTYTEQAMSRDNAWVNDTQFITVLEMTIFGHPIRDWLQLSADETLPVDLTSPSIEKITKAVRSRLQNLTTGYALVLRGVSDTVLINKIAYEIATTTVGYSAVKQLLALEKLAKDGSIHPRWGAYYTDQVSNGTYEALDALTSALTGQWMPEALQDTIDYGYSTFVEEANAADPSAYSRVFWLKVVDIPEVLTPGLLSSYAKLLQREGLDETLSQVLQVVFNSGVIQPGFTENMKSTTPFVFPLPTLADVGAALEPTVQVNDKRLSYALGHESMGETGNIFHNEIFMHQLQISGVTVETPELNDLKRDFVSLVKGMIILDPKSPMALAANDSSLAPFMGENFGEIFGLDPNTFVIKALSREGWEILEINVLDFNYTEQKYVELMQYVSTFNRIVGHEAIALVPFKTSVVTDTVAPTYDLYRGPAHIAAQGLELDSGDPTKAHWTDVHFDGTGKLVVTASGFTLAEDETFDEDVNLVLDNATWEQVRAYVETRVGLPSTWDQLNDVTPYFQEMDLSNPEEVVIPSIMYSGVTLAPRSHSGVFHEETFSVKVEHVSVVWLEDHLDTSYVFDQAVSPTVNEISWEGFSLDIESAPEYVLGDVSITSNKSVLGTDSLAPYSYGYITTIATNAQAQKRITDLSVIMSGKSSSTDDGKTGFDPKFSDTKNRR